MEMLQVFQPNTLVLPQPDQDPALYDAYDRDIAKVNFFFDAPTAAEYK